MCSSCTLGKPPEVHDAGVQGPECSRGGRTVTLPTFPLWKVHQGKRLKHYFIHYFIILFLFIELFCDPVGTNLIHLHSLLLFFYNYYWYFFNLTLKYPANAKILPFFIQGDDCQLKHVQVYNGLIKEMCKFYVNGFCMKGESCPYMHNILSLF